MKTLNWIAVNGVKLIVVFWMSVYDFCKEWYFELFGEGKNY